MAKIKQCITKYIGKDLKVRWADLVGKTVVAHVDNSQNPEERKIVDFYTKNGKSIVKFSGGTWIEEAFVQVIFVYEEETVKESPKKEPEFDWIDAWRKQIEKDKDNKEAKDKYKPTRYPAEPYKPNPFDETPWNPHYPPYPPVYPPAYPSYPSYPDVWCGDPPPSYYTTTCGGSTGGITKKDWFTSGNLKKGL